MRRNEIEAELRGFGLREGETYIIVCVKDQELLLLKDEKVLKSYPVSTSRFGTGNEKGSYKTPLGIHKIYKKLGNGLPLGAVFVKRKWTGKIVKIPSEEDIITTRILWLQGLEDGKNLGGHVDTKDRFIYIHGTTEEEKVGTPASEGCVRMRNKDIVELYGKVEEGTLLYFVPQCLFLAEE